MISFGTSNISYSLLVSGLVAKATHQRHYELQCSQGKEPIKDLDTCLDQTGAEGNVLTSH